MAGKNTYMDRAMRHSDPRFAHVLGRLGYSTRRMEAVDDQAAEADDLSNLRAQYQEVIGKRPYHGWDADELRSKIEDALSS